MDKRFLILLLLLPLYINAQHFVTNPSFSHTTAPDVEIKKIEFTSAHTIVSFSFIIPKEYIYGGWVATKESIFLRDVNNNDRFFLKKVRNIPLLPEKHYFTRPNEQLDFEIYFDPIDISKTTKIDLIEDPKGGLNFYNVSLKEEKINASEVNLAVNTEEEGNYTEQKLRLQEKESLALYQALKAKDQKCQKEKTTLKVNNGKSKEDESLKLYNALKEKESLLEKKKLRRKKTIFL